MRIIKLYLEDHELFVKDVDPDDLSFYQSHIAAFKRMWKDQGSTFWLRFLITFREYVKNFTFEYQKLLDKKLDLPICAHILSRCLDDAFIHIHKEFIEGDYSSAKSLLSDIFILAKNRHLITELESSSFVYDPFYSKTTRDSFRKLFGEPPVNKKAPLLKVWITCPVYLKFGGATCTVLRRWLTETDICEENIPDVNNHYQYWMPYENWTEKIFIPELFEEHTAKYWDDKLPSMLLTANVKNIFLKGVQQKCSCLSQRHIADKEALCDAAFQSLPSQSFGTPCKKHDNCLAKIVHGPDCSDPQFCSGRPPCVVSCENEIKKAAAAFSNKSSKTPNNSYWKSFEVFIEPCDKENCRNVGTFCETYDACVESYLIPEKALFAKNICDYLHGECSFPPNLPPEILNALMQQKKVEGAKERLRNKLMDKRQKLLGEKLLLDPAYRIKMYEQALAKFRREMETEALLCGCNNWEDHAHDICKSLLNENSHKRNLKKNKNKIDENLHMCKSRVTIITSSVGTSVAVGTDERSVIGKILQARKKCPKKTKNNNNKHPDEKNTENEKTVADLSLAGSNDNDSVNEVQESGKDQIVEDVKFKERSDTKLKGNKFGIKNACVEEEIKVTEIMKKMPEEFKATEITKKVTEEFKLSNSLPVEDCATVRSSTVSKNMDIIEKAIQENGGLGYEEIMLMLKTTEMLVGNNSNDKEEEERNPILDDKIKVEPAKKKVKLHVCAHCKVKEVEPSTFKKCSRCKKEKFTEPRYYCSRDCQVEDWQESHRDEHQRNSAIE